MPTTDTDPQIDEIKAELERLRTELKEARAENIKSRQEAAEKMTVFAREFRVPLASLLGFTDLMSATSDAPPSELNNIARAGHQLMEMVKSMERRAAAEGIALKSIVAAEQADLCDPNSRRVLHVEDNEGNFHLVKRILEDRANIDLVWADSAQKGLALATQRPPSLILLDLNLPDMHGSELLLQLKSHPLTQNIPIIVLSADVTPSQIERMLLAGARNYLTKPFEIKRFLCIVDESLANAA